MKWSARSITLAVSTVVAVGVPAGSAAGARTPHDPDLRNDRIAREAVAPAVLDCTDVEVIVFGNSIDYAAGVGEQYIEPAWPVQLERVLATPTRRVIGLKVANESRPGATTSATSPWGDNEAFRMTTYLPTVLGELSSDHLDHTLVVLAPSLADLQVSGGDIADAVDGIGEVVDELEAAGVARWIVLPINPIAHRSIANWAGGDLNSQIDAVNDRLEALEITPPSYTRSPLLLPGEVDGDPGYYDDFVNFGFDGAPKPPDYLHIDPDGHLLLAERLVSVVRPALVDLCSISR